MYKISNQKTEAFQKKKSINLWTDVGTLLVTFNERSVYTQVFHLIATQL